MLALIDRIELERLIDDAVDVAAQRDLLDCISQIAGEFCVLPAAALVRRRYARHRPPAAEIEP